VSDVSAHRAERPAIARFRAAAPPVSAAGAFAGGDRYDADYAASFLRTVMRPIVRSYFRVRLLGASRIPTEGPAVLIANHSGNAFPYDAMALHTVLWEQTLGDRARLIRTVYEPGLSSVWWMRPFGLDDFWRRGGGVDMTFDNFERLLATGHRVLHFPEGVPGIGKGFHRRYRLQTFHTSVVRLAARYRAPLVPVHIVNGEWVHPFGYPIRPLDRIMQRVFHVPFLPLPLGLLAIVLPWIWYLAFPARLVFVVGQPIAADALLRAEGVADGATPDDAALQRATARLRHTMQAELDRLVARLGRRPYDVRSLARQLRATRGEWWRVLPFGWPVAFARHDRDRRRPAARGRLHALLRDWDLLAFYLPFGWPLLSLARAFRRPPCGYRGLPRAEARLRQGSFLWRLADAPLSPARPTSGRLRS
jgi:1-acyl-sn-glycerol-3-phosphate acyltransferase